MSSISSETGGTPDISTISNYEKDQLIQTLQQEVEVLKDQVEEFNNLWNSVLKSKGKNGVRKLKEKYLITNDKVNDNEISYFLRETIWPHVKMMPEKWHKWSNNSKSICQRIMSIVGLPSGFIPEDYWMVLHDCLSMISCVQCVQTLSKDYSNSLKVCTCVSFVY